LAGKEEKTSARTGGLYDRAGETEALHERAKLGVRRMNLNQTVCCP
jgi:hypothetical protein